MARGLGREPMSVDPRGRAGAVPGIEIAASYYGLSGTNAAQGSPWRIDTVRTFAMVLVAFASLACDSDSPTAPERGDFEFESIVKVSQSGYDGPLRATLRSPGEWAQAWETLHAGRQPVPPRPSIDFGRSWVVLVAAGTRPDGCYSIDITSVQPSVEGQPVFDVLETQPGPTCVCTQAVTQPAHAVQINHFPRDAEFLERVAELAC